MEQVLKKTIKLNNSIFEKNQQKKISEMKNSTTTTQDLKIGRRKSFNRKSKTILEKKPSNDSLDNKRGSVDDSKNNENGENKNENGENKNENGTVEKGNNGNLAPPSENLAPPSDNQGDKKDSGKTSSKRKLLYFSRKDKKKSKEKLEIEENIAKN